MLWILAGMSRIVRALFTIDSRRFAAPRWMILAFWPQIRAAAPEPQRDRIVFLAGKHYRHHLAERLLVLGYDVEVPMEGLGIGEQLAWMDRAAAAVQG